MSRAHLKNIPSGLARQNFWRQGRRAKSPGGGPVGPSRTSLTEDAVRREFWPASRRDIFEMCSRDTYLRPGKSTTVNITAACEQEYMVFLPGSCMAESHEEFSEKRVLA